MLESPNTAADFARFISPTLIFIVSQVAIYAASVAFYFVGFYMKRVHLPRPSSEGGSFFGRVKNGAVVHIVPHLSFMFPQPNVYSPASFIHIFFVTRASWNLINHITPFGATNGASEIVGLACAKLRRGTSN